MVGAVGGIQLAVEQDDIVLTTIIQIQFCLSNLPGLQAIVRHAQILGTTHPPIGECIDPFQCPTQKSTSEMQKSNFARPGNDNKRKGTTEHKTRLVLTFPAEIAPQRRLLFRK